MISENNVKCFLDLSRTLSFTATAENLFMTQQAVSKRIDGLEKTMGLKLFDRSYHEVALTKDGLAFAELFERFKQEYEETISQRLKARGLKGSIMTVGYQTWSQYGDAPFSAHMGMKELFPGFELQGRMHEPDELMNLLGAGAVDIVILSERLAGPLAGYRTLVLKEIDIVLLVPKAQAGPSRDAKPETYAAEPFLIDANELANLRENFSLSGLREFGISPTVLLIRPNRDSVYLSVELGQGIALGSSISQTEHLSITKLPTGKKDNLICAWRENSKDPRAIAYANLLCGYFKQAISSNQ